MAICLDKLRLRVVIFYYFSPSPFRFLFLYYCLSLLLRFWTRNEEIGEVGVLLYMICYDGYERH